MSRRARQRKATWDAKRAWSLGPDPKPTDDEPLDDSEGGHPDIEARKPLQQQRQVRRPESR